MNTKLPQQIPTQLAFIFNNVADYAQLVAAFDAGVEVHVLDAAQDGLAQMAAILEGRSSIEALHVIGHGAQGSLDLGSVTLNSATIASHGEVLGRIGGALVPGGDILLYGCDVGADALGAQFVGAIAQATGGDLAASTDKTGGVQLGGNWILEHRTGLVTADGALQITAINGLDTLLAPTVKDVTDTSQKSPGLFVPGFTLTTSEVVVADPDVAVDGIYFDESGKTASFTITADGNSVAAFDLTGMTFLKLLDVYPHFRITITGHKAGGGTATAMIEFAQNSTTPTTPDSFSDMTGLTGFDVTINVVTVQGGGAFDLTLDAFTVDNVTAPAPGTPDLQSGSDIGLGSTDNITSANTVGFSGTGVSGASVLVFIDKNGNGVYDAGTDVYSTATASGGAWNVSGLSTVGLNGSYKVYAQQTVNGSVSALSTALDVTIDHTAPALAITSNRSTLKAGETATITFIFSEDPGTSFDASDVVVSGGALSGLTTTGSVRTAIFTPNPNTDGGTASITVASGRYTDIAGNNGGAGATPSLTFDTGAPTVTVSSSSTALLVGQTATITFTFSEDPGASFTWNGSSGDVVVTGGTLSAVSGSGTTRSATFTADGSNTTAGIQVNGNSYADAAGNLGAGGSSPAITVTLDSTPPAAPSTPDLVSASDNGHSDSDNLSNDTTPSFTGTAEAGGTVRLYDGATQVGSGTADGAGNWTITTSALSAGAHGITAVATDAAGNTGAASAALSITIDTSAPALAITSDRSTLKGGETATITFTFSEDPGAGFSAGDIVVAGGALGELSGTGLTRTAIFTPNTSTNGGVASITVAAGAYTDAAGNLGGAGATPALVFDTLAPTLAITSNKAGLASGETATITFSFSEDPSASFDLADVSVNGGTLSALGGTGLVRTAIFTPAANINGGNAGIGVAGGAYADAAGNGGSAGSVAIAFDTLAPSAPSAPVLDAGSDTGLSDSDQLTRDATPTVSGTAEAGATIKLYDGATEVGSTTADGAGKWSITSSTLAAGAHSLAAIATDAAGNTGAASSALSVSIDTSQPTLAITSDKTALKLGETATITFTFSEDPGSSFSAGDIAVSGGTLGELSGTGATRTATFTPLAGSGGAGSITVAGGVYTDAAGNPGGAGSTPALVFDTLAPTLAITSDKASLAIGETATITFTFSKDPGATFDLADVSVTGGTLSAPSGTGLVRTAIFTPAANINGGNAGISVAAGAYSDAAGNAGAAGVTPAISFDTLAPAASTPALAADSDSGDSSSDKLTSDATPTFSGTAEDGATVTLYDGATVIGTTVASAGAWTITSSTLGEGAHTISTIVTDAAGNASAPSSTLDVTIDTVAPAQATLSLAGDTGVDGDAVTSDGRVRVDGIAPGARWEYSLDAGSNWVAGAGAEVLLSEDGLHRVVVRQIDAAGNVSAMSAPVEFRLDGTAPTATVAISDNALGKDETATVTIAFSEAVTGFDLSDVSVSSGTLGGLSSADGGLTWTASFTPAVDTAAAENTIKVSNAGVMDAAGNAGSGVSESANYAVLTRGLGARIDLSDSELKAGERAQVTITFSEAVTRFDRADLNTPNAQLSNLTSLDGGKTWTAFLTPASGVDDPSNAITLDLGGVLGKGGLPGTGSATSANYTVSTKRPTASVEMASKTLAQGSSVELTIRFSEAVTGFDLDDISSSAGSISRLSSSDGITWTATLTAGSGLKPATVGVVTVDVSGVQNAAGNSGTGTASSKPYVVLPPNATPTRVDGVDVYTQPILTSTGAPGQLLVIPAIGTDRNEDPGTPNSALADIPLVAPGQAGGAAPLYASLPAGIGLQADGPSMPLSRDQALQDLIDRIESRTAPASSSQQEMSGQGTSFLEALGDGAMVRSQTIVLTSGSQPGSSAPIAITGAAPSAGSVVGLVIDGSALRPGSTLQLDHVQFAAVVGELRVIGGAGRNIVVGDGGRQTIFLGEDDDILSGGGGDDIVGSAGGDDILDGGAGNDLVAGGIGNDSLKGGAGDDLLNGGRSVKGEWSFFLSAGGAISARHLDAALTLEGSELVRAAEFDNASPELAFLAADAQQLEGVALLYAALGRAPDLAGLSFWSRAGVSLRDVADGVLRSAEWGATPLGQGGDAAFVRGMYQDLLGRAVDETGMAFWMEQLSGGAATRSDVLMAVAFSGEHRAGALTGDGYLIGQESLDRERGWLSSSGDDRLEGGSGNDQLVGGDGFDTAVFAGARHDYRILVGADGTVRVADGIERTVDTLSGIEAAEFGDGTLDLSFLAQSPDLLGAAGLLYQALLDRAGDASGLAWWLGLGLGAEQMAQAFAGSAEFQARFGAMSDAEFVRALYANSGLDASAAGGMAAWENYLDGHSRAELVAAWIGEDSVRAAHYGNDGIWLL